jgi:methyltransferase
MKLFWILICLVIFQRLAELIVARRNERIVRSEGAVEFDRKGYGVIVAMHVAFFVSLAGEYIFLNRHLNSYWIILISVFIAAQILRYWAITSLGNYWNTRILVIPDSGPIKKGPYKYVNHPNYIAVAIEIAVLPLIFSCYLTSVLFTVVNAVLLSRRIKIEEEALSASRSN